jgi:hypothetical protein
MGFVSAYFHVEGVQEFLTPFHDAHIQMVFCPETPTPGIPKLGTPATLGAHNFLWRPSDWDEVLRKIVVLVKSFPIVCGMPPAQKEIGLIPDF